MEGQGLNSVILKVLSAGLRVLPRGLEATAAWGQLHVLLRRGEDLARGGKALPFGDGAEAAKGRLSRGAGGSSGGGVDLSLLEL